jgi:hypothetical protein
MSFKRESRSALRKAARDEAARLLRASVLPRGPDETIKAMIARAARQLGWNFARTQDIWRHEAARIDAFEMDQLRRLVATKGIGNTEECAPSKESGG